MICQEFKIVVIEFEREWKLPLNLMDNIEKLQERGCEICGLRVGRQVAAMTETVTEPEPFFLDESSEALDRSIVWVQAHLGY